VPRVNTLRHLEIPGIFYAAVKESDCGGFLLHKPALEAHYAWSPTFFLAIWLACQSDNCFELSDWGFGIIWYLWFVIWNYICWFSIQLSAKVSLEQQQFFTLWVCLWHIEKYVYICSRHCSNN